MKKNLLYVLALVASVAFFTGCSDNDDPMIPPTDLNSTFGTDENTELTLNYGDTPLTGKQVKFETSDSKTATMTLTDVIPGEAQTVISNIQLVEGQNEYTFSGNTTATRASGATIEYSGSVKKGALTLNLKVTMADPNGWAKTYGLSDYTTGKLDVDGQSMPNAVLTGALYMDWNAFTDYSIGVSYSAMFRGLGSLILPQVLRSITLEKDGNISAEYSNGAVKFEMSWIGGVFSGVMPDADVVKGLIPVDGWIQSPKNLAYWFEKDGNLYVKLNVAAIIAQAMKDNGSSEATDISGVISTVFDEDIATLKSLLNGLLGLHKEEVLLKTKGLTFNSISDATFEQLINWVKEGIPLNVKAANGHTYIYLDKTSFDSLMKPYIYQYEGKDYSLSDFDRVWSIISGAGILPQEASLASFIIQPIGQAWDKGERFEIGLDLQTK